LLNAGLIPKLNGLKDEKWNIFKFRFGSYFDNSGPLPLQTVYGIVDKEHINTKEFYLDKLMTDNLEFKETLWYRYKKLQFFDNNAVKYLLIFDQFEELFGFKETAVNQFISNVAMLINNAIPQQIVDKLKDILITQPELLSADEVKLCYSPINLRLLLSIRSDKLSLLNKMTSEIPDILQNCYELTALTKEQAIDAIKLPAQLKGEFISNKFEYEDEAIQKIFDALIVGDSNYIETFQLQVICQFAEQKIIEKQNSRNSNLRK